MQISQYIYSTHIQEDQSTFGAMHPGGAQIYFVGDPNDSMVVVDSGEPYRSWTNQILDYYTELGRPTISAILITHGHGDHIGGLDRIQEVMNCPVRCHPKLEARLAHRLGPGCVVVAGAVINAFAELGEGCIVNTCASVGHDCRLGACVHVAPGANVAGDVEIGRTSWIGAGAAVRQGMTIGEGVMVGAGAAVVASVGDRQVVGGVPARPLSPSSTDAGTADNPDADPLSDTSNVLRLNLPSPQGRS